MNTRIHAFDLARGFAILVMVTVHTVVLYGTPALNRSVPALVLIGLGIPTGSAPPFMFVMGAVLGLSGMAPRDGMRRGLTLLGLGVVLNALRAIPFSLYFHQWAASGDIAAYVPRSFDAALRTVDILSFAGLAMILVSAVGPFLQRPRSWIACAAVVALGSPLLWGRMSGWPPLDRLLDALWGRGAYVIFPLFPWLAYVLMGRAAGLWLAAGVRQAAVFRRGAWIGAGLVLTGAALAAAAPQAQIGTFSRPGPGAVLAISGAVLLWMAGCHRIVTRRPSGAVVGLLRYWGQRAAVLYLMHWLVLPWALLVVGYRRQGWLMVGALAIIVLALAHQAARAWDARRGLHVRAPVEQPG